LFNNYLLGLNYYDVGFDLSKAKSKPAHHGFAMILDVIRALILGSKALSFAQVFARMMVVLRPRHGFAMMWAPPTQLSDGRKATTSLNRFQFSNII
jgi:hypothetical protein